MAKSTGGIGISIPGKSVPAGSKQSSGKTQHGRMYAPKVESASNLPKVRKSN